MFCGCLVVLLHVPLVAAVIEMFRGHHRTQYVHQAAELHAATPPPTRPEVQTAWPTTAGRADADAAAELRRKYLAGDSADASEQGTWGVLAEPGIESRSTAPPLRDRIDRLRLGAAVQPPVLRYGNGAGAPAVSVIVPLFAPSGAAEPPEDGSGWFGTLQGLYAAEGPEWATSFEVIAVPHRTEQAPGWLRRWPKLRVAHRTGTDTDSYSAAVRDALGHVQAPLVLPLLTDVAPSGPRFLTEMVNAYTRMPVGKPAVVGCRVVTAAGVEHPTRLKRCRDGCVVGSFGVEAAEGSNSAPVLYRRWAGVSVLDSRVARNEEGPRLLAAPQCFLTSKGVVVAALNPDSFKIPSLSGAWALAAGASLHAKSRGGAVIITAEAECRTHGRSQEIGDVPVGQLPASFQGQWQPTLAEPRHPDVRVVWDTFCIKCFGFTNEVMHYIVPLEQHVPVHSKQGKDCFCPGTPQYFTDSLQRLHLPKGFGTRFRLERDVAAWGRQNEVVVWVSHKDPGSYSNSYHLGRRPDYVVGRSMYEFTKIDPAWIPNANNADLADEIWVPSSFVHAVFKRNGIHESKLVVIPEPIDVHFFDPHVTVPLRLPARLRGWRCGSTHPSPPEFDPNAPPYSLRGHYKFLSVFKWEERKGWDVLLDAYFNAFTWRDRVSLYLLCYVWDDGDARNPERILGFIRSHAKSRHRNVTALPHIEVITEQLSEADMARVYRSCDAFVMPTRGEGWGLPIIQAMSMGLPAVATNWSGNVDFMRSDNSLLLQVEKLAPLPQGTPYGSAEGKVWAEPSRSHLASLMRKLHDEPEWGQAIGARARRFIVENYADEVIALVVKQRLEKIRDIVRERRRRRNAAAHPST